MISEQPWRAFPTARLRLLDSERFPRYLAVGPGFGSVLVSQSSKEKHHDISDTISKVPTVLSGGPSLLSLVRAIHSPVAI